MTEEQKQAVRAWKAGMEELNRLDLEEARNRSVEERLRNLHRFLGRLGRMDRVPTQAESDKFYVRWIEVRKAWDERYKSV